MSNAIERNVNIEISREDDDHATLVDYEASELASGSGEDAMSEAPTDGGAPVVPPPTKKTRWTKKKQELAKKAEMEAMGIPQKLPLTALSRRELKDMGLDTKTIDHIRNQAKRLNDIKKAEIDAETEMADLEVRKKQLALEQEKARVAELMAELDRARQSLQLYQTPVEEEYPIAPPTRKLAPQQVMQQPRPIQQQQVVRKPNPPMQPQPNMRLPQGSSSSAPNHRAASGHIDAQSLFY